MINNRLTKYVNEYDIIGSEQAGFRKGFSTLDHILTTVHFDIKALIDFYLGQSRNAYIVLLYWLS